MRRRVDQRAGVALSGFTTQACRRNHFAVIPDVHPSLFDCCGNLSLQIGAILLDIGVAAEFAGPSHEQRFVIPCGDSQSAGTPWRWNYIYAIVEPLAHFYARCLSRIYAPDRKSTRLNSSHLGISYAVFCLKK